jgi:hypothetical protein
LKEWGTPHNYSDISGLFTRYLHSDPSTPTTPFCDLPLSPETATILSHLLALNGLQYWTVGSQPAVDAVKSEDPVHGWGPRGGYVFQKAFVEFFVRKDEMEKIQARLAERKDADISFYASNKQVRSQERLLQQVPMSRVISEPTPGRKRSTLSLGEYSQGKRLSNRLSSRQHRFLRGRRKPSTSGQSGHCSTLDCRQLGSCLRRLLGNAGSSH